MSVSPDDKIAGSEPIAICGIGLRLPGGIRDAHGFWDLLVSGRDARSVIPASRFAIEGFDASLAGHGAVKTRHGYFLEDDLSCLDTSFFSMSRSEVERCDPQQRLLLEVVRECLDDAGETNYRGQPVGCFVGAFGQDWLEMGAKEPQHTGSYTLTGYGDLIIANRVSYEYDLRGPSLVIKTGCSASMVALHEACRALQSGDASAAVVAGTSLIMTPSTTALFFNEGILSPDASCKTFDASADGFARAEGITAIYIKRLKDAVRDGNPIRAVIRATGSNSDGRSHGLMNPSAEAHEALMRKVYQQAGMDPSNTAFVECHGTGTPTGDPTETRAVGNVFGKKGVYIGSVKPNIGHSEGSSGLSSLIKAVLALEHRTIPPNIKFVDPNPKIPFAEKKLTVPIHPTPFPEGRAERISINSFGIGGSNAHVIVDSSSQYLQDTAAATNGEVNGEVNGHVNGYVNGTNGINGEHSKAAVSSPELLLFSTNSATSLSRQIDLFRDYTAQHPKRIADVAYTLALRREKLSLRAFAIIQDGQVLETSSPTKAPATAPSIAMIFSGQGAQWPGMGRELILSRPSFRQDIIRMDKALQGLKRPPTWSLLDKLLKPEETDEDQIHSAELAQPLTTALQIALVCQYRHLGITPLAVVGHSSGEIAAAYAAGYISLEYAITVAYYRGYVVTHGKGVLRGGMMAAVGLGASEVSRVLQPGVCVACDNSPTSSTISGDREAVESVLASIRQGNPEILARPLRVDVAYHSHHMAALQTEYLDLLQAEESHSTLSNGLSNGKQNRPKALFLSSVTCKPINQATSFAPPYWAANLVSPVRFSSAVTTLLTHSDWSERGLLLEIGPHSALAGPLRQICEAVPRRCNYISSQMRGNSSATTFLSALGGLYQESVPVDWKGLFPEGRKTLSGLPQYPWDHSGGSFWYESRLSRDWRTRRFPHHCLLGARVVESPDTAPLWRNVLNIEDMSWIRDHKVRQDIVFPIAGYIAMAGEAVRQTTGCDTGYRLRHVVASTALVVADATPTEMVTTLHAQRLTDSDNSVWFDFEITSYNGSAWVKHCAGQVMPLEQMSAPTLVLRDDQLSRRLVKGRFYEAMARIGIVFGTEFQLLTDISSSATERLARAKLTQTTTQSNQPFPGPLHPASIDGCIQLLFVANAQGLCRNMRQLFVPTLIENIEVSEGSAEMSVSAMAGSLDTVECVTDDNRVAFRMSGLRVTALNSDGPGPSAIADVHAAARLQWLPDLDFADVTKLFKPPARHRAERQLQEVFTLLCSLESADVISNLTPCQPHFSKYREWLHLQVDKARAGEWPLVVDAAKYADLSPGLRRECLEATFSKLLEFPGKHVVPIGIKRICDHAEAIFTGQRETLDLLTQDNILTEIYNEHSLGFGEFVRLLSHTRPNLRILEVGAGTGGTTELTLRHLVDERGCPTYSQYMFTDISAGFFPQARERFSYAGNMAFQALDISQDALGQGFAAASYDLILAPNVVHATPCLRDTLANLKALLKPDGMLLLTEISTVTRSPNYVFGNFSGWWLGEGDSRPWEPYVPLERWDAELKDAGFTGADAVFPDDKMPYQVCVAILSKPCGGPLANGTELAKRKTPDKSVTVLCQCPDDGPSASLILGLRYEGWAVTPCKLGEQLPSLSQDIIASVDLETSFFDHEALTEAGFSAFQNLLRHLKNSEGRLLWLTRPFQIRCRDPRGSQTLGVARTVRTELAIPFFTLEVDFDREAEPVPLVAQVFGKIRSVQDGDILNSDKEFVVNDGVICIGRYHPFNLTEEMSATDHSSSETQASKTLTITKPGALDSLRWRDDEPAPTTLPDNTIEIDVRAAGLNFRDVLLAMGVVPPHPTDLGIPLGLEAAGVVRRVGAGVTTLQPGDRVMALSPTTTLCTRLVSSAAAAVRIPDAMTMEAAATVPVCFTTVLHALLHVGRLRRGDTVLVHSACGGVGLAALQVCRAVGADVYATVGNERKVEYLVQQHGIPRSRIFGSRDASFAAGVMRETAGRGVDLVLNSLSGELLHESWACVAEYGTMIELGKRDLSGAGRLNMAPFLANRTYAGVDVHQFLRERPERLGELLAQYLDMYSQGQLRPLDSVSCFDAEAVEQAFRYLQNGDHIGKVVVTLPSDVSGLKSIPRPRSVKMDPDAAYLLVGGCKGLGSTIATWLVEQGARHLTFLSRSAGKSPESKALFEELRTMGCSVSAREGSVEKEEDVQAAIAGSGRPIKGVFQLAMVLSDAPFVDMEWAEWNATVGPKVRGTWNLHHALADHSLDFFWMASSIVAVVDQPGQGNYSAGCTFLEAFCQYRHSLGLPATVLNICPIIGAGYVDVNPHARKNMKAQGLYFLGEHEFLDFVELGLVHSGDGDSGRIDAVPSDRVVPAPWQNHGQVIMGLRSDSELHLDDPSNRTNWRCDRRMGIYHNVSPDGDGGAAARVPSGANALSQFLSIITGGDQDRDAAVQMLAEPDTVGLLAREIGKKIHEFMLKPVENSDDIDTGLTLVQIGLDSLMAIELRRWFRRVFSVDVSVLEVMGSASLMPLGGLVAAKLAGKLSLNS